MIILEPLNIAMSLRFLAICLATLVVMKAQSILASKNRNIDWKFLLTPLPSYETWERSTKLDNKALRQTLLRCLVFLLVTVIYFYFYWEVYDYANPSRIALSYLAAPLIWLIGEWLTSIMQLFALVSGKLIPPHHNLPILSRNLTEFWGKRWNTWFTDWFNQVWFRAHKRRPLQAVMITFLVSGIGHELVMNLPYYQLTGKNLFGTMIAFFAIQGVGVILDNRIFKKNQTRKRFAFQWFWLLASAPLFMNESALSLIHAIK